MSRWGLSGTKLTISILICFFCFSLIFVSPSPAIGQEQDSLIIDYVFVIDTSGSMAGEPAGSGNVNIFPQVKQALIKFLQKVEAPANVFLFPFDAGIHDEKLVEIQKSADIKTAIDYVNQLEATGESTWIYQSLKQIIDTVSDLRAENHYVIIYLYTDGQDNDPTNQLGMRDILEYFALKTLDTDWLYYCTLGAPLPEQEKSEIQKAERVIYIDVPSGEVLPPFTIIPKLQHLSFGNLRQTTTDSRTELFLIHNQEDLPADFQIKLEPGSTPTLSNLGVTLRFTPETFAPQKEISWEISLVNAQSLEDAQAYSKYVVPLVLRGITQNPNIQVLFAPNTVLAEFLYEPPKIVTIQPGGEPQSKWPVSFGSWTESQTFTATFDVKPNEQASKDKEGKLNASIGLDPSNPSILFASRHFTLNNRNVESVQLSSITPELVFTLRPDVNINPGVYNGWIQFESDDFSLEGKGLEPSTTSSSAKIVRWDFSIPAPPTPPMPIWQIALFILLGVLVCAILIVVIASALSGETPISWLKKTFGAKGPVPFCAGTVLEIREPREHRGEQIELSGNKTVRIGQGTEILPEANAVFSLRSVKEGGKDLVAITVEKGEVLLKKAGRRDKEAVFEERLYDGDIIKIDIFEIRFCTVTGLTRD